MSEEQVGFVTMGQAQAADDITPIGGRSGRTRKSRRWAQTLEDSYRCAEICDAIVRSHESGRREEISDRS
jgi:hypothetical protein